MDISGTMRIYKNEYEGRASYSTTLSKKDQFGNYENLYITVQLPRDITLENNSRINVKKGFLSFFKTKQGLPKIKAVVQVFDMEIEEAQKQPHIKQALNEYDNQSNYYDNAPNYYGDDLPF